MEKETLIELLEFLAVAVVSIIKFLIELIKM